MTRDVRKLLGTAGWKRQVTDRKMWGRKIGDEDHNLGCHAVVVVINGIFYYLNFCT
jgi:hypothetical protein